MISIRSIRSGSPNPYPNRIPGTEKLFVRDRQMNREGSLTSATLWLMSESSINASSTKRVFAGESRSRTACLLWSSPVGLFGLQRNPAAAGRHSPAGMAPARRADISYSPKVGFLIHTRSPRDKVA